AVFGGVGDEVADNLRDARRIGDEGWDWLGNIDAEAVVGRAGGQTIDNVARQYPEIDRFWSELEAAGFDARAVEQIAHHSVDSTSCTEQPLDDSGAALSQ